MNLLSQLRSRFRPALATLDANFTPSQLDELLQTIRPSADAKFGDYQANFAMSLGKQLGKPPREIAQAVADKLDLSDLCDKREIAGPGFINLRIRDDVLATHAAKIATNERVQVSLVEHPRKYIIDYSAPNVAKPMHVGHIRSTVIGAALANTLRFLGHHVITDNHIGDWGTQFGMILYGYKHFRDHAAYHKTPVAELSRLYRLVSQLVGYHESQACLPPLEGQIAKQTQVVEHLQSAPKPADKKEAASAAKGLKRAEDNLKELIDARAEHFAKITKVESDLALAKLAHEHEEIGTAVLRETAKLHSGDAENLRLWHEVLPACRDEIDRVYRRLGVTFDHTLGESFYHERLAPVVENLVRDGVARPSDGAICVFLPNRETPFLVRKQDGAFLYATTDLATIEYRMETWRPDAILYVVDHRQSLHFEMLFETARLMGLNNVELQHVSFGTVLGEDGRPFKTRSGDTVGLEALVDEAVSNALAIVSENDDGKPNGPELSVEERQRIAERVGVGALKYADLSQNRTSDYIFSYAKMLAMTGNTATYMQYAYARVLSIFNRGGVDVKVLRTTESIVQLQEPTERALALELARFAEAIDQVAADYRPNHLTTYLFELANRYSAFFESCPVLKAETSAVRDSRLKLCDATAAVLKQGLGLLGIETVERM